MKKFFFILFVSSLLLVSCNSKPSLEKYFVENSENKNFLQVDLSPSILNNKGKNLLNCEPSELDSFKKINFLAFKINDSNKSLFEKEKTKVQEILKNEKYQELMKFNSGNKSAQVSFVGTDDKISEFILFGSSKENGFAIARVIGKDMNLTSIMSIMNVIMNSGLDSKQLEPFKDLLK